MSNSSTTWVGSFTSQPARVSCWSISSDLVWASVLVTSAFSLSLLDLAQLFGAKLKMGGHALNAQRQLREVLGQARQQRVGQAFPVEPLGVADQAVQGTFVGNVVLTLELPPEGGSSGHESSSQFRELKSRG